MKHKPHFILTAFFILFFSTLLMAEEANKTETKSNNEYIKLILGGIIPIVSTIILGLVNHQDKNKESKELDKISARIELLSKIKNLIESDSEEKKKLDEHLKKELEKIIQSGSPPVATAIENENLTAFESLSNFKKFFLVFRPKSFPVFLLQFLYFYTLLAGLVILAILVKVISGPTGFDTDVVLGFFIFEFLNLVFAYFYHRGAINLQIKKLKGK